MFKKELGIIGTGKMGSTLLEQSTKIISKEKIIIYDINQETLNEVSSKYGVETAKNNAEIAEKSKYILIAVVPQVIDNVLSEIKDVISEDHVIISIAAGVSISHIGKYFNKNIEIIRIMSNVAALIGEAASVISSNEFVTHENLEYVRKIFEAVGLTILLEERHLNAVTGLSGSGPAYIFLIIESLADGGVKMGLPRDVALKLAAQTVLGAAKMVLDTKSHPAELRDKVATPGGTTITALHLLESQKLRASLITAVEAATRKSQALNSKE
ncbi:MAG: Pyrroline-5-carboxylate reductase [Promethearchaeota archaeon]|nr:MAG: Pyrroline-5-carboxylate reductase [Candidatus Lokiarchaeota archaeon]